MSHYVRKVPGQPVLPRRGNKGLLARKAILNGRGLITSTKSLFFGLTSFLVFSHSGTATAGTWYVNKAASEPRDGLSLESGFATIQEGIDAATDGDTVTVAEGTYVENADFGGKNIVLRSTDPLDPDIVATTVIDGNKAGSVVTFDGTEDETCVLSRFTIRNGQGWCGGGIRAGAGIDRCLARIQNNVITGNSADRSGGGLEGCNATIQNNITYKAISPSTLWYNKPATEWKQALPLGNGRLGAMVFGDVNNERIQFNEDSVWTGKPQTTTFATDGPANFSKIRKLIFEGKRLEAQKLYTKTVIKDEEQHWDFASYQPTGDLWLDFEDGGHVTNYKRVLNLNTAISTVSYTKDEVNYKREVFVSHPDQAIIVRLTADQKSKLSLKVKLTRPYKKVKWDEKEQRQNLSATAVGDTLILNGDTGEAIKYQARLKPIVEDGTVSTSKNSIDIRNASSVTLYLAAETNFINYHNVNKKFNEEAQDKLKSIVKKAYSNILSDHIRAHQEIFNRLQIELPKSKNSTLPTDQRIKKFAQGEKDPSLAALIFQFGRYTLLTSSRPNTQPANLQGLWNNSLSPSWDCKYTTNINFQMNYWPVDVCNLGECIEPFVQKLEDWSAEGQKSAKTYYGVNKGWALGFNSDLWSGTDPKGGGYFGAWHAGGAWCCTQLWDHYLFYEDQAYLQRVYPVIKGAAEFFVQTLVEHPESGFLVTCPSASPENWYKVGDNPKTWSGKRFEEGSMSTICAGPTIDNQILRYLFDSCIKASEILKKDQKFRTTLKKIIKKLPPNKIGKHGQLQEWMYDWDLPTDDHRHFSHLWGMYPGTEISVEDTPSLSKAVAQSLKHRTENGTGFGQAWQVCLWARMYKTNTAHRLLRRYVKDNTCDNLFSRCYDTMQVDGTLGISAGIAEMLLQSHRNELHLLPALPQEWGKGQIKGLRARGGMSLEFAWQNSKLTSLTIHSNKDQKIKLRHAGKTFSIQCHKGENIISVFND